MMIIILKIILSAMIFAGGYVFKTFFSDFRLTQKTEDYEESTLIDKLKIKAIFYFSLVCIFSFCLFLLYFVISPMQITW